MNQRFVNDSFPPVGNPMPVPVPVINPMNYQGMTNLAGMTSASNLSGMEASSHHNKHGNENHMMMEPGSMLQ